MKKSFKLLSASLCAVLTCGTVFGAACGGTVTEKIDKNKTQIYVNVYNGGLGVSWFDDLRAEWNAKNDKYEVISVPEKKEVSEIVNTIRLGETDTSPSIYFSVASSFKELVERQELENLEEWANTTRPDGEGGLTVREKLNIDSAYYDLWCNIASNTKTGGLYMLPWNEAISGFVYDHDTALDPNEDGNFADMWLIPADVSDKSEVEAQGITCHIDGKYLIFDSSVKETNYKQGGVILRAGRDGKFGTYDDGQPITIAEWDAMIGKIVDISGYRAFMWTGQFETEYLTFVNNVFMAQYSGLQSLIDFYDKDSGNVSYEMYDGTSSAFNIDTGYKSFSMKGIKETVDFVQSYLKPTAYLHPSATESSYDHSMTQGLFVMGYRGSSSNPKTAMILEGSWWENEARTYFASNAESSPERGYGKRDYRFMLTPMLDGGVGAFGNGKGTAMAISELSSVIVPKCSDPDKLAAIKDFLAFSLKDENLRKYTVETGVVRPYVYTLTAEDRSKMTPFARCNWDIYKDSENIGLVKTSIYQCQPIQYATVGYNQYPIQIGNVSYGSLFKALDRGTPEALVQGIANAYSASSWKTYVDAARSNGFYK